MIILLLVMVLSTGAIYAYTGKMQETTLYLGRQIAGPNMTDIAPRGFQDAITSKAQDRRNIIGPILIILMLAVAFTMEWYMIPLALVGFIVVYLLVSRLVPQNIGHYYSRIVEAMHVKHADYVKHKDYARAEAAQSVIEKLEEYWTDGHLDFEGPVPDIEQAKQENG